MNFDFLKNTSKETKREFLEKLRSGKYELHYYERPTAKSFILIPEADLYRCKESGEEMTLEQIRALPGYLDSIELVSTREQVQGSELPDGVQLIPLMESQYLNSLLVAK